MKLIVAIVQDEDSQRLINELMTESFRVTKLATTGGFLRSGNTTLLVGVEDGQTDGAIAVIETDMQKPHKQVTSSPSPMVNSYRNLYTPFPFEVIGRRRHRVCADCGSVPEVLGCVALTCLQERILCLSGNRLKTRACCPRLWNIGLLGASDTNG